MKRYLNRDVFVYADYVGESVTLVRDVTEHNGRTTCIIGGKTLDVHCADNVHPTKAHCWFTNELVSRETIEIAKRARRHR